MNTVKRLVAAVRNLLPAYLRGDKTPEEKEQQVVASTTHG